jgi:hypothetical protein
MASPSMEAKIYSEVAPLDPPLCPGHLNRPVGPSNDEHFDLFLRICRPYAQEHVQDGL